MKIRFIFFSLFTLMMFPPAQGQDSAKVFSIVDTMPTFPDGMTALLRFIGYNINYPIEAQNNSIQGKVYVSFVVDTIGEITDTKILKDIGGGCGQEAVNVLHLTSGLWEPGIHQGKKVNVRMTVPVKFTCNNCGEVKGSEYVIKNIGRNSDFYFDRGFEEYQARRYALANYYFTKTLELDSSYTDALYNRGASRIYLGKVKEACEDWATAKKYGDKGVQELIDTHFKE